MQPSPHAAAPGWAHRFPPTAQRRRSRLLAVCYIGESINERIDFRKYSTDYLRAESARRRRHLARRFHPAMGVARRSSLNHLRGRRVTLGGMAWQGQNPPATDVLLHLNVPCSGGGSPAYLELDKLPDGMYRATVGTLFEHQEICRTRDLEALVPWHWRADIIEGSSPPSGRCTLG